MGRILKFTKKAINFTRNKGFKGIEERIDQLNAKIDIYGFYDFIMDNEKIPLEKERCIKHKNDALKTLNWIIPEIGVGSGGHINIFRFISHLENLGFHSRIYIHKPIQFKDNENLRAFVKEHFEILDPKVEVFYDVSLAEFAHATIATSWQTAYFVRNFDNCISKFYFVQDFEPYFFALGSEYAFAENTYKFGLRGITAGDWLKNKLREEYHMKTESFGFSYEHDLYYPIEKRDKVKRIFFYARPVTPRRDFELGLLALKELCERIPEVEVFFAGWDVSNYEIPFKHKNAGILKLDELSDVYAQCDMCLIISNTNLSLLPLEVMASNSVAVCSKGENSTWLVNEKNSILVDYDPVNIADTLEYYLKNPKELEVIRKKGLEFARKTSWEKEAKKVRDALLKGIKEDGK